MSDLMSRPPRWRGFPDPPAPYPCLRLRCELADLAHLVLSARAGREPAGRALARRAGGDRVGTSDRGHPGAAAGSAPDRQG